MARTTVLLVEDDTRIAGVIADQLREERYDVVHARSAAEAERTLGDTAPDLALVDVMLPDGSGFELCRRIRHGGGLWDPALGIMLLTARTDEVDVLRGFERGADDYVRKPFSMPELIARVDALVARRRRERAGRIAVGSLEIDIGSRRATFAGVDLGLSGKEFDLLVELASAPGVVRTKAELLRRVWDSPSTLRTRTVDSHASRLRRKLVVAGAPGDPVANTWGRGYRLELQGA
jgi:two-component system phosphate regulon response regulator PhoB